MEAAEQITQRKHVQWEEDWSKDWPLRNSTQQGCGGGHMINNTTLKYLGLNCKKKKKKKKQLVYYS